MDFRGIGVLLNGMFGCVTVATASVENAGLLALTRVGSRRVIQISAGFMIFFSVFGKFGALFASIPLPIVAALYCVFFGYVSSAGLCFLQFRTKFILGISFVMDHTSTGHIHYSTGWFDDTLSFIFMYHATVAALVALILDCSLSRETDADRKDAGLHWWEKFSLYTSDGRNDEFYTLPCRPYKLFPVLSTVYNYCS